MRVTVSEGMPKIVYAEGQIDLANVDELKSALTKAVSESPHAVIIDFTNLTYIDSAGIQAILAAYKRIQTTGGNLLIVIKSEAVRDIFDIIHIEAFPGIDTFNDIESAMQKLSESR